MGPTGDCLRVVQIHPTRRCNLHCLHCYSSSGPREREELPSALLVSAIEDAQAEGFNVVGFSGGEPLLYRPLPELLDVARAGGMRATVTTNGMLLDERRLAMLAGRVCLIAISLDGVPDSHNRMRASRRAFPAMAGRLEGLRQSGIPFGFIFTLTLHNVHELAWVAEFAAGQGARLLQIHPLEIVGHAARELPGANPDDTELAFAYLEAARIQQHYAGQLHVQLDVTNLDALRAEPERAFAGVAAPDASGDHVLAELVSPIIIEADGTVVPVQHGFARAYALGNLHERPLRALAADWRRTRYDRFRRLCRQVFADITGPAELPFANWYERIADQARREQPVRAAASPRSIPTA